MARREGLEDPLKFGRGVLWSTKIKVAPDNKDLTASQVAVTMCQLFRVITEFDKWRESQTASTKR